MPTPEPPHSDREVEIGPLREAGGATPSAPGVPVDHSREAAAMTALRHRGFTAEFIVDGDTLRITGTDRRLRPEDVRIVDHYRFEGTSDPDDMSVIYALAARDGTRGTLVDAFGSYADPAVGAVLDRMHMAGEPRGWRSGRLLVALALGAVALSGTAMLARWRRTA